MQRWMKLFFSLTPIAMAIGVFLRSPRVALVVTIWVFVWLLVGFGWLLWKRCQFGITQLLTALLLFGGAMAVTQQALGNEPERMAIAAATHALTVGVGMFLGARSAAAALPRTALRRWNAYLCGLLLPYLGFLSIAALCALASPHQTLRENARFYRGYSLPLGVAVWGITLYAAITTVAHLFSERDGPPQAASSQTRDC